MKLTKTTFFSSLLLGLFCSLLFISVNCQDVETTTILNESNLVITTQSPGDSDIPKINSASESTDKPDGLNVNSVNIAVDGTTANSLSFETTTEPYEKPSQTTVIPKPIVSTESSIPPSSNISSSTSLPLIETTTISSLSSPTTEDYVAVTEKFKEEEISDNSPPENNQENSEKQAVTTTTESDISHDEKDSESDSKEEEKNEENVNEKEEKDEKEEKGNEDEEEHEAESKDEEIDEASGSGEHQDGSGSGDHESEEEEEEEEDEEEDSDLGQRIVERLRALHEKAKEMTVPRPPATFNQSMDRIFEAFNVVQENFLPSHKTMTRFATLISDLNIELSRECLGSLMAIANGLREQQPWAYRFLDASGKLRDFSASTGRIWSYGDYRECLSIKSPTLKEGFVVHGQYCTLEIQVPLPRSPMLTSAEESSSIKHPFLKEVHRFLRAYDAEPLLNADKLSHLLRIFNGTIYRMGVCLPELCVPAEVERIIANLTEPIFKLPVNLNRKCDGQVNSERINSPQAVALFFIGMFIILVILCTAIEAYNLSFDKKAKKTNEKLGSLMFHQVSVDQTKKTYAFSMLTSFRCLFSAQISPLSSVQSLKYLLIVYVHLYNYYNFRSTFGLSTLRRLFTTYPLEGFRDDGFGLLRTTLPFDLLSLILGFELAFEWRKLKNAQSWKPFTILRDLWILLTVTFLASVVCINLLSMIGHGPAWNLGMYWLTGPCYDWTSVFMNILNIANFNRQLGIFESSDPLSAAPVCNPATWFISVLFQLSIVVAIILSIFSLLKHQKAKITYFMVLLTIGIFFAWYPYIAFDLKPEMHHIEMKNMSDVLDSFNWYRTGTLNYLIFLISGVAAGLALAEHSNVMQRGIENFLLFGAFVIFQVSIALNNSLWKLSNDENSTVSIASSLLYYGPIRALNSVGIAFFIFCFTSKRIPKLKAFLECRPLLILGRLSHSYLLTQSMIIFYRTFSSLEQTSMDCGIMMQTFVIDIVLATVFSAIFFCLFESPTITLLERLVTSEKLVKQKKEMKSEKIGSNGLSNDGFHSSTPKIVVEDWGNTNQMQRIMKFEGEDYPSIALQNYKSVPEGVSDSDVSTSVPEIVPEQIVESSQATETAVNFNESGPSSSTNYVETSRL